MTEKSLMGLKKPPSTNSEIVVEIHFWGIYQKSALALETEFKKKGPGYKVIRWTKLEEAMKVLAGGHSCIFIMSYNTDEELSFIMAFLTAIKDNKNPGQKLRTIVLNKNNTPKIIRKLVQEGANKVIQGTSSYSAIKAILSDFSANLAKSLKKDLDLLHGQAIAQSAETAGSISKSQEKWKLIKGPENDCDCWHFNPDEPPKKIVKSWHLLLEGPPPDMGDWVQQEQSFGHNLKLWHFVGKEKQLNEYVLGTGVWSFVGMKPEYKNPNWNFKSEKPLLAFYDINLKKNTHLRATMSENSELLEFYEDSLHSAHCREMLSVRENLSRENQEFDPNDEIPIDEIAQATLAKITSDLEKSSKKNPVVLIFEDDEDVQNYLKIFFHKYVVECKSVSTADDYLWLLKSDKPDICIIDLNLEGNDRIGFDLLKSSREVLGDKNPIIMISATKDQSVQQKAASLGVTAYIEKPLYKEVLNEKLEGTLKELEIAEWDQATAGEADNNNYHQIQVFDYLKKEGGAPKRERPLILVVDDDAEFAILLKLQLKKLGFDCETRERAESFLPEVKPLAPDICIIDLNLDLEGLGFIIIMAIRKVIGDTLPLIVVSARADEDSIQRALTVGANAYLKKPIEVEELKAIIARYDFRNDESSSAA